MPDESAENNSADTSQSGGINLAAQGDATVGGDVVGRDKIIHNIQHIYQRTLSVTEKIERKESLEARFLASGVTAFVARLQARASDAGGGQRRQPYKGLLEYHLGEADMFFGRSRAIAEFLEVLQRGPLTILHAETGAGKTSLLQAGISPHLLAQGHLPVLLRPYNTAPGLYLRRTFLPNLSETFGLAQIPLHNFLARVMGVLGPQTTLYILLDEFEEFFTQLDAPARDAFVGELAECLDDDNLNVRWILALRTEYFGNLARFRPRIRNPFENDFRLDRLTRAEAQEVVGQPAARCGLTFEAGLIDTLLDDLGADADTLQPPQLQIVCSALYEELPEGETTITQALYNANGGAAGVLRGHLSRVLKRDLPAEQRSWGQRLLEALTTADARRVRRTRAELAAELAPQGITPGQLESLLSQLVDSHLLRVEEDEAGMAYELAHDYLLEEIKLDPATQARKAAQELLEQEVRAYQRFGTLIAPERLAVIRPHRAALRLTPEAEHLLSESETEAEWAQRVEEARRQTELNNARKLAESEKRRAEEQAQAAEKLRQRERYLAAALLIALSLFAAAMFLVFRAR